MPSQGAAVAAPAVNPNTEAATQDFQKLFNWASQRSTDTLLERPTPFKLSRADLSEGRVPTPRVVKQLDVVEHVGTRLLPTDVLLSVNAFGLQGGEEALHRRIVPTIPALAHAASDALVL